MSRYTASVKTASALASGTTFANVVSAAAAGFKVPKVVFGFEGATAPSQASVGLFRATARGTATTTVTGQAEDPSAPASAITGMDTAWSTNPTLGANPLIRRSFDVLAESEWVLELPDELRALVGTANGVALQLLDNPLPTGVLLTATVFWDE